MSIVVLGAATVAAADPVGAQPDLDGILDRNMDLSGYTIQDLDLPTNVGTMFDVIVDLGGTDYTLFFEPHSVRASNFQVYVQGDSGELVPYDAPAPRTYRGTVDGVDGAVAQGSLLESGLKAMILFEGKGQETWFIQPLSEVLPGAPRSQHVVYRASETIARDFRCGVDDAQQHAIEPDAGNHNRDDLLIAELACDADYPFYQANGSSEANTIADVENIIDGVNIIYERDVTVTHTVTAIIVRTSSGADPYTTTNPSTLLSQFRSYWINNHGGIQRDLAELFTGRNLDGSVIGIAWLNGVCTTYGYSVVQSRYTSNYNNRVTLSAHELGHQWSAGHCDGDGDCHIMCSYLGGCNGIGMPNFGIAAKTNIRNYAEGRPCLDVGTPSTATMTWIASDTEVGVNQPIILTLWATWDPAQVGFAATLYEVLGDDDAFAGSDTIDVTEDPGDTTSNFLGRNPSLRAAGTNAPYAVGDDVTADPSGVDCFQLPPAFNGDYDYTIPMQIFKMEWRTSDPTERTVSYTSPHQYFNVYNDPAGSSDAYQIVVNGTSFNVVYSCPPDWNGDGTVNSQDFIAFLNDFTAGNADYNGDTTTNSTDFIAFLNDFVAGC
jgi:hypothetical protein